MKSEPLIEKKGTAASPATALANSVLPVPGGPTNNAPLGILAPNFSNFVGSFKNCTNYKKEKKTEEKKRMVKNGDMVVIK